MNEKITEKARELAELLKESDAFKDMHFAEDTVNSNSELLQMSSEYERLRFRFQEESVKDEANEEAMTALRRQMNELHDRMLGSADMKALQKAREDFSQLMALVNYELQSVLNPESLKGGCGGSCSSCQGCH